MLCHEGRIEDPTVYVEAFEVLKERGRIRAYGVSTDSLDVLKRFEEIGTCDVVEVNYSLLNRAAEAELLPYCAEHGIGVLVRGPLRQGLLAGKYTAKSVFSDAVRSAWNEGGPCRERFLTDVAGATRLASALTPGQDMVTAALRYVISHPSAPVAIPGSKSPEQAAMNAAAGAEVLTQDELDGLTALLDK